MNAQKPVPFIGQYVIEKRYDVQTLSSTGAPGYEFKATGSGIFLRNPGQDFRDETKVQFLRTDAAIEKDLERLLKDVPHTRAAGSEVIYYHHNGTRVTGG